MNVVARRTVIVSFWVAIIIFCLYLPSYFNHITTDRSISLFTWTEMIDPHYVELFEQKSGIKVHISYYENNEELYSKLAYTQGRGYDLLVPTDYMTEILANKGWLKKLDKTKLNFWHTLHPHLLGHYFDPHNEYSIPFYWDFYGIGFDRHHFALPPPATWDLIFKNSAQVERIGMLNDARDVILLTALYLFGTIDGLTQDKLQQISLVLRDQKRWVEVYTDLRADYLLSSQTCSLVVAQASFILRTLRTDQLIGFLVPKEGTALVIDTLVIPALSTKQDLVYQFLNFLFEQQTIEHHFELYGLLPANVNVIQGDPIYEPALELLRHKQFDFFRNVLPFEVINNLWISLKA